MTKETATRRRWWILGIYGIFGLWILEWIFSWSAYAGPLESSIWILWTLGLLFFVFESRSGRAPRWLHTWGWMGALLLITGLRAWVLGDAGILILSALFADVLEVRPDLAEGLALGPDLVVLDALVTSMFIGFVIGFAGLCEALLIGFAGWAGDLFRERREPARAALLPRLGLFVLQTPIFIGLLGVGLAAFAGAVGVWAHPDAHPLPAPGSIGFVLASGLGGWALAVVHLRRLSSLAAGGRATRVVLGVYGLVGAVALVGLTQSVLWGVVGLVWLLLQIAALRRAGPRSA